MYKNKRIAEITAVYTNNYNNIINTFNNKYRQIINGYYINKKQMIHYLNVSTNLQLVNLKIDLNLNISKINSIVVDVPKTDKNKYAMLVGINYVETPYELNGCINDVESIESKLLQSGFLNFIKLTDNTSLKPTKKTILNKFTALLRTGNPGDLLCFFYSGHGSYIIDKSGDEADGRDEAIVSLDMNIITDDELKYIIQTELKEGVTLLAIFDSCYSGSIFDLKYMYNDSLNFDKYTEYDKEFETKGSVICLSSSNDNQTSSEALVNSKQRGAFCACLTDLITDKNITWRNLLLGIRQLLKDSGFEQIPQLSSGKIMNMDSQVFF